MSCQLRISHKLVLVFLVLLVTLTEVNSSKMLDLIWKKVIPSFKTDDNSSEDKSNVFLFNRLTQLTKDLWYMSESDYSLEPVSFSTPLTNGRLIEFAQLESPTGTSIQRLALNEFLQHHTSEERGGMLGDLTMTRRFQVLQSFMINELDNVLVYRVGNEPKIVILALGTAKDGQRLVGFRTVSIET